MLSQTTRLIIRSFGGIPKREIVRNNRNLLFKRELNYQTNNKKFNSLYIKNQFRNLAVHNVKLESLGDSIPSAVILEWKKNVGDKVNVDDIVTVVETDKVTIELRAKNAGVLVQQFGDVGSELLIGADLYALDSDAAPVTTPVVQETKSATPAPAPSTTPAPAVAPSTPSTPSKPASSGKTLEVPVPRMGESISQGVVGEWQIQEGSIIRQGDVVASIETDKVTIEVQSPFSGKIVKLRAKKGDEVLVDQPLFVIEEGDFGPAPPKASTSTPATAPKPAAATTTSPAATPAASKSAEPKKENKSAPTSTSSTANRSETRVKMTRMRQRIAERLKSAQNTAAMLTTFQEVDMGPLIDLRNKYKDEFEKKHGVKLGFMSAFVKASSAALIEIPAINARIDDATKEIIYHNYTDISVAVASPTGLVVPVLRNCEKMSFADVEKTIGLYGKKAKDGTLALEEMSGGTFTISNGGVFGSLFGTPIINPPQSAILGMHATKQRAVVVNGKVEARPMMYLALTYDHRLIDGREAVTFLKSLQGKIEDPSRLLLDL